MRKDWIQQIVKGRAESLGLSAVAIAKATGGKVSHDQIGRYLAGTGSISSQKLQYVFSALQLEVK